MLVCLPKAEPLARTPKKRAKLLLEFVREHGKVHPREVNNYFSHGTVRNYWGGSSNATTHLLGAMHYRGMLRVTRRDRGVRSTLRIKTGPSPPTRRNAARGLTGSSIWLCEPTHRYLVLACLIFAPAAFAVPQWRSELRSALQRVKQRLSHARVEGVDWYWPAEEDMARFAPPDTVRLLTPFDPVVWDRDRFELLWGWPYRFEAYTPAPKRKLGYYAMPLLWRDRVVGWGNSQWRTADLSLSLAMSIRAHRTIGPSSVSSRQS